MPAKRKFKLVARLDPSRPPVATPPALSLVKQLVDEGEGVFALDLLPVALGAEALSARLRQHVDPNELGQVLSALGYPQKQWQHGGIRARLACARARVLRNSDYWLSKQGTYPRCREYVHRIPQHLVGLAALRS